MKSLSLIACLILFMGINSSCSKSGGGNGDCTETGLAFTSSPAVNSLEAPAPGPDFPLTVTVTEPLPSAGVEISVSAKPEAGGNAFFTQTKSSNTSVNNFTITGTPQNAISIVTITVTSKSCATNKASGSYRYSMK